MFLDNKLKIPPKIEGSEERYDSVNGFSASSRIFIVYDNGKSYPEYLIKYSSKSLEDNKASFGLFGISPFSAPPNVNRIYLYKIKIVMFLDNKK